LGAVEFAERGSGEPVLVPRSRVKLLIHRA
jgi:hypothetical protein